MPCVCGRIVIADKENSSYFCEVCLPARMIDWNKSIRAKGPGYKNLFRFVGRRNDGEAVIEEYGDGLVRYHTADFLYGRVFGEFPRNFTLENFEPPVVQVFHFYWHKLNKKIFMSPIKEERTNWLYLSSHEVSYTPESTV